MSSGYQVPPVANEVVRSYKPNDSETKSLKQEYSRQKSETLEVSNVIAGQRVTGKETYDVSCPHEHGRTVAKCHSATEQDTLKAIDACLAARESWAGLPWNERAAVFLKAADLLAHKHRDRINASTMLGQSKTAHQAEIDAACELIDFFRFNAKFAQQVYSEQPFSPEGQWNRLEARGLEGFVFAIAPFNFTSIAVNLAAAPALMGCTVLWKPSPQSMLGCHYAMEMLEEAGLPPGVINLVGGDPQTIGDAALNHPDLSGVHFTGSTKTFNMIWQRIGQNIERYRGYPRVVGETGGKDFIFAHASADQDALSCAMVRGAFEYQGQKCSAASRAFVPKSIWQRVKGQVVETTNSIKVGDVGDFSNFMGAVIDERAFEKIKGYIDQAKSQSSCKIIAGGECNRSEGYFVQPTIIETSDPKVPSMVEEIFGPVLTVYPYEDSKLEDALTLCDTSSPYALTGAIFAQDRGVVDQLSARLRHAAGNFYINDKPTGAVVGQQPFGGGRRSGTNDKAGSVYNLLRWVSHRTIKETFHPPVDYRYPYMGV